MFKKWIFILQILYFLYCIGLKSAYAQVCATPGFDGSAPVSGQLNTYYPAAANTTLTTGSTSISLAAVPNDVTFNGGTNTYSKGQIHIGDLLLIIQMQDATINSSNSNLYGANSASSGSDGLGGTGYTSLGNTGFFEYVVATSDVPITGGTLTFRGAGTNSGVVNTYYNIDFNAVDLTRGKRTFQVVRVPQYSNVTLTGSVLAPPFNGNAGGVIAFDVAGNMNFNGQTIDASARGFRGGFSFKNVTSESTNFYTYVLSSSDANSYQVTAKGEGVVGSSKNMWDGFVQVINTAEGLPNGSLGRGAPGNGGGGGSDINSGGGGGGNGGNGGVGGNSCCTNSYVVGGRPGYYTGTPTPTRLFMGGGGGAGEVNDADLGDSGGVGGGIILVNVGKLAGSGNITSNGSNGQNAGWCNGLNVGGIIRNCPVNDGAGGAGAGGTVLLKISDITSAASLNISAVGGNGGNAGQEGDMHGCGGGGGGGLIFYNTTNSAISTNVALGPSGHTTNGTSKNGASDGTQGQSLTFTISSLPSYLQGGGAICYPRLSTTLSEANAGSAGTRLGGAPVTYTLTISNESGVGNAGGVIADLLIPTGITYQSVTVTYTGGSGGDSSVSVTTNQGTSTNPRFGNFVVAPGGSVVLTLLALVNCSASSQTYNTSAQVYYLDPTRNVNPLQRICPSPNVFPFPISLSVSTSYESGGPVAGSNYNGSVSSTEDVIVSSGTPILSSILTPNVIQSGSIFSYTPTSSFVFPSGGGVLTFAWSRGVLAGISNGSATGTNTISEVLVNTTTSTISVPYLYTLSINGCIMNSQTVTIAVNPSVLTFSGNPNPVNGGSTSTISVSLPGTIMAATTITLSLTKMGSAIADTHYVSSSVPASVTIPMGQNSITFTLQALNANVIGLSTTLGLTGTLTSYTINGTTVTIVDITGNNSSNDVINIGSGTISESLSKTLLVGLTGTVKTFGPLTVTIVSDKVFPRSYTANDGRGSQSISGSTSFTVVIPANQNSVSVTVFTFSDGNVGNNVFNLTGSVSATGFTINPGVLTVVDIDAGGINGAGSTTLTITSGTVSETLSKTLSVSLPAGVNTNTALTVTLGHSPVFPVAGYSIPANVVIQAGQNSATFVVNTAQDGNVGNNVFSITGTATLPNYVISTGTLTVIDITVGGLNGTGSTTLTISSGTVSETLSKTLNVSLPLGVNTTTALTVTLGHSPAFPVVGYSIPASVVIQAGQNSAAFVVSTVQDGNVGNNIFSITGTVSLPNYVISTGTLTVVDITAGGLNGTGSMTLTIGSGTVSETLSKTLSVSLPAGVNTTTALTVTLGYTPAFPVVGYNIPANVVIQSGQNSATFVVTTAQDGNVGNNIFSITGTASSGNYLVIAGTLTVVDITAGGINGTGSTTLTISSGTVSETLSKTLSVSLPVGVNTTTALTVTLGYSPVFPVVGYNIPASVVIQAGQNSAAFVVSTVQDGNVGNNIFSITGTVSLPNYVISLGTLTVVDITAGGLNGTGSTTLTISSGTVSETLSKTLSVSLPTGVNTTTALTITLGYSPAFPVVGYNIPANVVIQSGQNSATFVVNTSQDGNVGNNIFSISGTVSLPNYVISMGTLTVVDITAGGINSTGSTTVTISSGMVSETLSATLIVSLPAGVNTTTALTVTLGYSPVFPVVGYSIPANVVIQAGQNSATFVVNTAQDGNVGNNVFSITGTVSLPNYAISTGTLTVIDITAGGLNGTGSTTLTISSGMVSETLSATLIVSLPAGVNTTTALTITFGHSPVFPVVGYSIPANVVIQAGQNSATFVVNTAQDGNVGNNIFSITGTVSLPNYVISAGTLTVVDTTAGTGSTTLTISSRTVSETLSKTLSVSLPAGVNTNTALMVTLGYSPVFPAVGYSIPANVVIQAGQNSATFVVNTAQDGNVGNNIFSITGTALSGNYLVITGTLTVVDITAGGINGTGSTTLTISSGTVSETLSKTLSVSLPAGVNTTTALTVTLGYSPVFPVVGYNIPASVVIQAGQNSGTFVVNTAQDGNVGNNIFSISGTVSLPNYVISMGNLTVVDITAGGLNGTGSTTLTISSGTVSETLSKTLSVSLPTGVNTTTALTITLGYSPVFPVVGYSIPANVVIQAGQNSATFVVNTSQDGNVGNNIFSISGTVSLPNYVISMGTLTVVDITAGGINSTGSTTVTISSGMVSETLSATLIVSLPAGVNTTTALTVTLGYSPVFPVVGYSIPANVVIQAGQNSATFVVNTAQDGNVGNNVFSITGTVSLPNYTISTGTLTVIDITVGGLNGTGSTTLTISSGTVNEGSSRILSVSLPSTVNVTTTSLTVTINADTPFLGGYTINSNSVSGIMSFTVVIPGGQHQGNYTIQTASDSNIPDNIFHLSGSPLTSYTFVSGTLTVTNTDSRRTPVLTITSSSTTVVGGTLTVSISTTAVQGGGGIVTYRIVGTGAGSATIDPVTGFITAYKAGLVVLIASSSGDTNYSGVTTSEVLTIGRGTPTLSLTSTTQQMNVDETLTVSATSYPAVAGGILSAGILQYSIVSGSATINQNDGLITAVSVGTVVVQVTQSPDANYNSPIPATLTITINPSSQTLSISSINIMSVGGTIAPIVSTSATGGRGGSLSYSISNGPGTASIDLISHLITGVSGGTMVLNVSTLGDANYGPASVSQTITIVILNISSTSSTVAEGQGGTMILSLNPSGVTLPRDVTFAVSGSIASSGHYHLPTSVVLQGGQTSTIISIDALTDKILYNDELLVVSCSDVYLGSVSGSISITDVTSLSNRLILLSSGTIFQDATIQLKASLPSGFTTARAIVIGLGINPRSDFSLLSGQPVEDSSVTIPVNGSYGYFNVSAASSNSQPAKVILNGTSLSFTVEEGVVTVLNKKLDVGMVVSRNGDGVNDCFLISNIEKYPDNTVGILDRDGNLVYQSDSYNNSSIAFCGASNQGHVYNLPDGTYYYEIRFVDKTKDNNNTNQEVFYGYFELK